MTSTYKRVHALLRGFYHLVPARLRTATVLEAASGRIARGLQRIASHDEIYDENYYRNDVEAVALQSAPAISASIVSRFNPRRVIDVGCGTGALLAALRDRGCEVVGLEYSDAGLAACRGRGLNVHKFDIEHDTPAATLGTFDVAITTEVAEHLPARCADRFVALLTAAAPIVIFTAAPPGQGGIDHVNEQPPEYWIAKFEARGCHHRNEESAELGRDWQQNNVAGCYWKNVMLFTR